MVLSKVKKKKVESRKYPLPYPSWQLAAGQWFSPGTPLSSTNKTDHHNITVILLKVVLNTVTPTNPYIQKSSKLVSLNSILLKLVNGQQFWPKYDYLNFIHLFKFSINTYEKNTVSKYNKFMFHVENLCFIQIKKSLTKVDFSSN